jgi:hypothetical protein
VKSAICAKSNSLLVKLEKEKNKTEITLNLNSTNESSIRTIITNAYRLGYDKIKIKFKKNLFETIKQVVEKNLLGFEIIKREEDYCELESITEPAEEQFENIFSKIFLSIEELFKMLEKLSQGKKIHFENEIKNIQKYDNFCKRIIVKKGKENNILHWTFHTNIVHGAGELNQALKILTQGKSNEEIKLISEVKKVFETIKKSYLEKDLSILEKVHDLEAQSTYKIGYNTLSKSKNSKAIHHLMVADRHFYLANSPLSGIILSDEIHK